jgi:hypothetical protein
MVSDEEFRKLKDDVDEIKKILKEAMPFLQKIKTQSTETKSSQTISFGDFAKQKNPHTHEEKALTIAYYVWQTENRNFVYDDIVNFCKKIAWPTYSNPAVLIRELKKKGFVEEVGKNSTNQLEYRILESGINFVDSCFKK